MDLVIYIYNSFKGALAQFCGHHGTEKQNNQHHVYSQPLAMNPTLLKHSFSSFWWRLLIASFNA